MAKALTPLPTGFRPMKGENASGREDELRFPLYATPKLDGIRAIMFNNVALSYNLKPLPNQHIQRTLAALNLPDGFDGELTLKDPTAQFGEVSSAVMGAGGTPDFLYNVFDWAPVDPAVHPETEYLDRLDLTGQWVEGMLETECVAVLHPEELETRAELDAFFARCLALGFEGAICRQANGLYKFGRSTVKQGDMVKLKPFVDGEAQVIGYDEEMRNMNKAEKNNLGLTKRSSTKANKVGKGILGRLRCRYAEKNAEGRVKSWEFNMSSGLTKAEKVQYWGERDSLVGRWVKFKFQKPSPSDTRKGVAPRSPIFLGFRDLIDFDPDDQ